MAISLLTLNEVRSMVYEALNISKDAAYGTHDGTPLYKSEYVRDCIFNADDMIVDVILRTPGHPRRGEYMATASFTTPGVLITLSGNASPVIEQRNITRVMITKNDDTVIQGSPAPAVKISQWIQNLSMYGGNDIVDGFYDIIDSQLIFSGKSATVHYVNRPKHADADTNLQAPYEYKGTLVRMALKELLGKDPERRSLMMDYERDVNRDIQIIATNGEVPAFEVNQQGR